MGALLKTGASVLALLAAPTALAQQAPAGDVGLPAGEGVSDSAQDIIVTGSRIVRRSFEATSPIVSVDAEILASTGNVTLEGALNQLPQFAPGTTAFSNGLDDNGQATLNLRGLGAQRNLVLLDGRRLQPSSSTQVVDINTLPSILIGGAEIITGGASAVYGSDAISGVVNFTLRQIEGIEVSGQNTITSRGDGGIREIGIGAGTRFADGRGRITVGASYTERDAVNLNSRDFFRNNTGVSSTIGAGLYAPSTNPVSAAAIDAAFGAYGIAPGTVAPSASIGVNADGTLFSTGLGVFNYRGDTPYIYNNGTSLAQQEQYTLIQIPLQRKSVFGKADFEVAPSVTIYAQGLYTDYQSTTISDPAPNAGLWNLAVPITSPFIPDALKPLLASRPNPDGPLLVTKRYLDSGPRLKVHDSTTWQILAGVTGTLVGDVTFDFYGSHGKSSLTDSTHGSIFADRTQQMVAAADGGAAYCGNGTGFDPFAVHNSPECTAYFSGTTVNRTSTTQDVLELTLQGPLAKLPAGDLRFALGADYRRNKFAFAPDPQQIVGNVVGITSTSPTGGSTRAIEGFAELLVPLLRDLPAIHSLEVDLAYRYSDYDHSGGVSTYKADVDWRVTPWLQVRGGYQRAIRAPNVGELFTANTGLFPTIGLATQGAGDPCDIRGPYRTGSNGAQVRELCLQQGVPGVLVDSYVNNVRQVAAFMTGNTALTPEKANTYTIGAVFSPRDAGPWLSGLSLSVDYYHIEINDAIATIPVTLSLSKCFNGDGSNPTYDPANYYCKLIGRTPTSGGITNALMPYLNIGGYRTSGVDVQFDWSVPVAANGLRLGLSTVVNYLKSFEIQNEPGSPFQEFAGTTGGQAPLPRWRATTSLSFGNRSVGALLRWRHLGGMRDFTRVTNPASNVPGVQAFDYFDLSARAEVSDQLGFRFGINNLADRQPPVVGGAPGTTNASVYETLGRTFYLSARMHF